MGASPRDSAPRSAWRLSASAGGPASAWSSVRSAASVRNGILGAVHVAAGRCRRRLGRNRQIGGGHDFDPHDFVDGGKPPAHLGQLDRPARHEHGEECGAQAALDFVAIRSRGDQDAALVGFHDELEQPDRLPVAGGVHPAHQDRTRLRAGGRLPEQPVDERSHRHGTGLGRPFRSGEGFSSSRAGGCGRCLGEQVAQPAGELFGRVRQRPAFLDLRHQRPEDVDSGEQDVCEGLDVVQAAASECPEQVLHGVGQVRHAAMSDGRRGSLQRVSGAEDLVDHCRVDVVLELEQALFDPLDLLQRLVDEETVVAGLQVEGQAHLRRLLAAQRGA